MDTLKAIWERSSCRDFKPDAIPEEDLEKIIEAGLHGPTGVNFQPLRFNVVSSVDTLNAMTETCYAQMDEAGRQRMRDRKAANLFYGAPTVIFISSVGSPYDKVDGGIAVQSMALAAQSLGYGSCIIAMARNAFNREAENHFCDRFGFAPDEEFVISIAVGKINTTKEPHEITPDHVRRF